MSPWISSAQRAVIEAAVAEFGALRGPAVITAIRGAHRWGGVKMAQRRKSSRGVCRCKLRRSRRFFSSRPRASTLLLCLASPPLVYVCVGFMPSAAQVSPPPTSTLLRQCFTSRDVSVRRPLPSPPVRQRSFLPHFPLSTCYNISNLLA